MNNVNELSLSKHELQQLINKLMDKKCSLYWRHNDNVVFLVVDTNKAIDELAFTKDGFTLTLKIDSLNKFKNKEMKNEISKFLGLRTFPEEALQTEDVTLKSKKHLQLEIDYHLLELHEYIQQENNEMISAVKDVLLCLTNQLKYHSER